METIHTGWLVKSPPERPWKLLKPVGIILCTQKLRAVETGMSFELVTTNKSVCRALLVICNLSIS